MTDKLTTMKMDHLNIYVTNFDRDSKYHRKTGQISVTREVLEDALGIIPLSGLDDVGIMVKLEPVFLKQKTMTFYQAEGRVTMEHDSAGWTCYIDDDALQFGPDNYEEVLRAYQGRKVRITLELIK